ncbi:hypothetical protein A3J19_00310 [Candidatus Daviesbacteria bacterium RIFCSPLOWO2_02_FULL_41_8]|uniref:Uncharacterized protein n=4 Tax=Patescibacteria group TaxID=1783273 RepID=A0A1F5NJ96_9BACT|nr:MAG: hypothetical protein A2871_01780 [Candidatus Daviesbacteria bacterium RIFCSPHIGHO2_01_FULL_41_23]OGE33716.1 MAG: hypothetical protein A3D83_00040 [Candidatus Daviesbacteria bacterium RIFCSPHIGHO2_02_FULL_41_10]OGE62194.1 MAG: hypothetical protein A2967_00875 [Candidatus Daviesbacteria bacterium RIFCSPLOWO2_01_FULL_41_32]OGE77490.1 MAG: hypothetical protein A3J19_00310 [Candidatus Daviesbacteria bacterium RIFCSPLOWO2_02_FULL_41_8]OGZ38778.1 MAG: hypothetical protein A3E90_02380 [Candidat
MDDPKWLKFMAIGLVLAAVAIGYFLLSGRLSPKSAAKIQVGPSPTVLGQDIQMMATPTPAPSLTPGSATDRPAGSAYSKTVERSRNETKALPNTGFPVGLAAAFSVSALIAGWGLRRFPK